MSLLRKITRRKSYKWVYVGGFLLLYVLFVITEPVSMLLMLVHKNKVQEAIICEKEINKHLQNVLDTNNKQGSETIFDACYETTPVDSPEDYVTDLWPPHCFHAGITTYEIRVDLFDEGVFSTKYCPACQQGLYTADEIKRWQACVSRDPVASLLKKRNELIYEMSEIDDLDEWIEDEIMSVIELPVMIFVHGPDYYLDD